MQPKVLLLTLLTLGAIGSLGYWMFTSGQYTIRGWFEEDELVLELYSDEAYNIAFLSACSEEGQVTPDFEINEGTRTWWFDMVADKPGCNPACVVDDVTKEAEINWRCTGLTPQ
ncbi:MAG: hypothetical protein ABII02_03690 [Candidatus Magasanikbacteria bacterium]